MAKKRCECGFVAEPGMKYCKVCLPKKKRELRQSGYLEPHPRYTRNRPKSAREDTHETSHGIDD